MKIISLDDDKTFLNILKRIYRKNNITAQVKKDKFAFYESLINKKHDLITIDLYMNGKLEGFDIIKKIRENENFVKTPIIAMSRASDQNEIDKAIHFGANDYISKPLDEFSFMNKINILLKQINLNTLYFTNVPKMYRDAEILYSPQIISFNDHVLLISSDILISKGTDFYINHCIKNQHIIESKFTVSKVERVHEKFIIHSIITEENRGFIQVLRGNLFNETLERYRRK